MRVLKILSLIWKSGANIYLDKKDGRIAIDKQNLIPTEVMNAAEDNFQSIDTWFKGWGSASAQDITIQKSLYLYCGWQTNEKLNNWLCSDDESLNLLHDWTVVLAKNGWTDIYDDFRKYENAESDSMKNEFYERAKKWSSANK